ncbi:hypothetical protein AMJ80_05555 [bacterium SM23_31]|nr:MAG: hypothetical protein AMJ80_05555 [bacterium SM23_31]
MKKTLLLILIFMFSGFSSVVAQTDEPPSIFINWGPNKPMLPEVFYDFWQTTFYDLGGGVEKKLQENISVFGMFEWHKFSFIRKKGFPVEEVGPVDHIAYVSTISGTANVKYSFNFPRLQKISGYVYGGGGLLRVLPSLVDFANKIKWYYDEQDELDGIGIAGEPIGSDRYSPDVFKFKDNKSWIAQADKKMLGCAQAGFGISFAQEEGAVFLDVRYMVAFSEHELTAFLPIKVGYIFSIR